MTPADSLSAAVMSELHDQYEIIGELGRGGTSIVYHARERELGRDVAIKIVAANQLNDSEAAARLAREARLVAVLSHPNIVPLLAVRHLSSGLALIMQHVPGRTLKRTIREDGALPVAVVERVLADVGAALEYAHRRHIVHRDIKPENIYLDSECGRAVLADFGIARTTEAESSLTLVGTALGTPAYMSPEQIDGITLDGRSDLYSLGLVAYEMLTGQQPWAGCNLYTIIYKQKHDELPPLTDYRQDVPHHLQSAVVSLLRKNRDERCSDAANLLALLAATPVVAHAPVPLPDPVRVEAPAQDSPTIRFQRPRSDIGPEVLIPSAVPEVVPALPAVQHVAEEIEPYPLPEVAAEVEADVVDIDEPPMAQIAGSSGLLVMRTRRRYLVAAAVLFVVVGATAMTAMMRDRKSENRWATLPHVSAAAAQPIASPLEQSSQRNAKRSEMTAVAKSQAKPDSTRSTRSASAPAPPPIAEPNVAIPNVLPETPRTTDFSVADVRAAAIPEKSSGKTSAPAAPTPAPDLRNREDVQRALTQYYPAILRDMHVGGDVLLSVLIDDSGKVVRARVDSTSGVGSLDQAALKVVRIMRFTPAPGRLKDSTWVQVPVKFQVQ